MDHNYIWDKTKSVLKDRLPAHAFETWFEPIKPLNINGTKLVLQVPNQFFSEWVDMHYRKHIISTLEKLGAGPREIKYVISTEATNQLEKTTGNIDKNSVFYLMSRGLSKEQANRMLVEGFLNEAIETITEPNIQ